MHPSLRPCRIGSIAGGACSNWARSLCPMMIPKSNSIMGKVAQLDAWSIEIGVDRFDANFAAWGVLTNLLGSFSATRRRITSVVIE